MIDAITGRSVRGSLAPFSRQPMEYVQRGSEMRRLLASAGWSIDDVVNSPVARRQVISFFRIGKQMTRIAEVDALERQWNWLRR